MRRLLAVALLLLPVVSQSADNYREPRDLVHNGSPVTVYVAKDKRTEVVLPERIVGALPPVRANAKPEEVATEGLSWTRNPTLDRVFLMPSVANYQGTITLHGASGASYILYLRADRSPDILVTVQDGKLRQEVAEAQSKKTPRHKLIEFMMLGKVPPGYRHKIHQGPIGERTVYRQGAVVLYLQEVYSSPRFTGLVIVAENTGRTPVYFPIESLDFAAPDLRKALGNVQEISIDTPYLGPHPRYASEAVKAPHQSFLYVQARKEDGYGR